MMYKENTDTNHALSSIVRLLHPKMKTDVVGLAGTKDKRGCKSQCIKAP